METDEIKKLYYRIGEVSEMLDETEVNIRFWMKEFNIPCKRARGRKRLFTDVEIATLKEVKRLLRVERYTTEGAKLKLI